MFPVRTGMNRGPNDGFNYYGHVPRTHGDEPAYYDTVGAGWTCSPYARG